ncbi:MAG: response regulator [Clostridia bacterium]|nr:response regulator [Clostridia bacterium]
MRIIVVDDESVILGREMECIRRVEPTAKIEGFLNAMQALRYVKSNPVDVAFLDVMMPEISGIDLAKEMKRFSPNLNVIFATAFNHLYKEAMELHASGYIVKPIDEDQVRRELSDLRRPVAVERSPLFVRAFGDFEVFYENQPVMFRYMKSKELFAYLIDRHGTMVESDTLLTVLWGGETDYSNFFYQVRKDLRDTLRQYGCDDILLSRRGAMGVATDKINCDYYEWLKGTPEGINAYHGQYMRQYDWAEMTWVGIEGKTTIWEE